METDHQYKARVIDTKSKSFCAAKWYNATIWLGSGMTTSCHHPLPHKIDIEEVKKNYKLIHNTPEKKEQRREMQCGERPAGCEYCWKIEDIHRDNISDRIYKTVIYDDKDIQTAFDTSHTEDINLQTLEISFDRTCNFACSYCNPAFSTTWVKDLKQNGGYENLISDGRNHFTHEHKESQLFGYQEYNPYIEAFWKWWESDLHKTLQELRVTGGEPMMSADMWKLFDWFKDNHGKSETRLAINSNLCPKDDLMDKLIEKSHYVKHFHLYTSNESIGTHSEYIRDGMEWINWCNNIDRVCTEGNVEGFHMMCTINSLCLFSLTDFLDLMLDYKFKYGKDYPTFTLNILRFPSFQSPLVLPEDIRTERKEELQKWLDRNKDNELLHQMEINQTQRLIDYLDVVKTPHREAFEEVKLKHDFKNFWNQYDTRRGKSFESTWPRNLVDWYRTL
jgi:organic radical activating enzyme